MHALLPLALGQVCSGLLRAPLPLALRSACELSLGLSLGLRHQPFGVMPQQLRYRGVLQVLSPHECRPAAFGGLQRGVSLGVEQRLHDRGVATGSRTNQGGVAVGVLHVDARAALQQHPHHRLLPSIGGRHQQRRAVMICGASVHFTAQLVQPRSHSLRVALLRRVERSIRQPLLRCRGLWHAG
eukprot:scaffold79467_cov80-Phaeocystis_antarctica.AAC.2